MPVLTRSQVRQRRPALALTAAVGAQLDRLLGLDWEADLLIPVEKVHQEVLRSANDKASTKALSRLVEAVNAAAGQRHLGLEIKVTTNKKSGNANRYLWFEGPPDESPPVLTGELDRIPAGQVIADQRGLPADYPSADAASPQAGTGASSNLTAGPRRATIGNAVAWDATPPLPKQGRKDLDAIACERLIRDAPSYIGDLHKGLEQPGTSHPADAESVVAHEHLLAWAMDPAAAPLFALLGEYGMGKTVTCQRLKQDLDARREQDPATPLVLYFDLRLVTDLERRTTPTLAEVVKDCMARGWQGRAPNAGYGLDDVLQWAQTGALVIFDGLDEVLVKLSAADGQTFTRGLLGLRALIPDPARRPKLLISCRTHYFRTLRDQQNHFTGQERAGPDADAFRALILLPLTDAQVRGYLTAALPDTDPDQLLATIAAVHNLTELTQRPYTLKLVADHLPAIEQARAAGQVVQGVTLYRAMVRSWLERDSGKHHIRADHKLLLAADLAAHLWREGSGLLPVERIEDWFFGWLERRQELRSRYARLNSDQLEEDLRTATFLVRDDQGGGGFRFAHTSLLEYFLAEYLLGAIRDDAPERWAMPRPSPETLDFLGQLLDESAGQGAVLLQTLGDWHTAYRPCTSEVLLAYALRAWVKDWPMPPVAGIVLAGAQLDDWRFGRAPGAAKERTLLDLSGADLRGCTLRRARFDGVRLTGARLCDTKLAQADFLDCEAANSDWSGAECDGAIWRRTMLTGSIWDGVRGRWPRFINCVDAPAAVPGIFSSHHASLAAADQAHAPLPVSQRLVGHMGGVWACAFAPDGTRMLSGSEDGTLRLWDVASGAALLTLTGHEGDVWACAFAPDGTQLLSGGEDGTLRLWDAASGAALLTLTGHAGWARACAFAPDGTRLLSGGNDETLRLWDAASGAALLTLTNHAGGVLACAFAPDGTQLLSGNLDGTLRLWDAASGAALLTLTGHDSWCRTCACAPDGTRLLSGGGDGTLRLWDAVSGTALLTLTGHADRVLACAFAPDSTRLLSGGEDGTLRLWDAASGAALLTLTGHDDWVRACAFAPDGTRLLSRA